MFKDQQRIKLKKQAIIQGETHIDEDIPAELQESWIRSKLYNLDSTLDHVPIWTHDENTLESISEHTKYIRMRSKEIYKKQHDLLAKAGYAIFYLNEDFSIFSKGGNQELLDELRAKNIKFSTNFSEKHLGTTAVSIAAHTHKNAWVIGEEHYIDLFKKYACYASIYERPANSSPHFYQNKFISLFFIPIDKFSTLTTTFIEYITVTKNHIVDYVYQAGSFLKDYLLENNLRANKTAIVIADKNEIILDVNDQFCISFGVRKDNICGTQLLDVIPNIKALITKAYQGEQTLFHTITLPHLPEQDSVFYVDCKPIFHEDEISGLALMITRVKDVQRYIGNLLPQDAFFTFDKLIGESENFKKIKKTALQAAQSTSSILIYGESGTGKEMFAQAMHNASPRKKRPFIAINCAAIPKELIGSELFGYTEGAFTGAKKGGSIGKFEQANNGTLFLDEIAEMPLDMQSVLLRIIEDRKVTRLGGTESHYMDVKIIAATNRDLYQCTQKGKFRLDLYYRLNVIRLDLIPLRERRNDIPLLVAYYLDSFNRSLQKNITGFTQEAMQALCAYEWPGNAREVRNVLERCCNLTQKSVIPAELLPSELHAETKQHQQKTILSDALTNNTHNTTTVSVSKSYSNYEEMENHKIQKLMIKHRGNKSVVAHELGITRGTLYRKLKQIDDWDAL